MIRLILFVVLLAVSGCVPAQFQAPQSPVVPSPVNPGPVAAGELQACYFDALAKGVEDGWLASPNEVLARAKTVRERLGLPSGGADVDALFAGQGASVEPFTTEGKKSLAEGLRSLARKARGG